MQSTVKDLAVEYKLPSSLNLTNIRSIGDKLKDVSTNVRRSNINQTPEYSGILTRFQVRFYRRVP